MFIYFFFVLPENLHVLLSLKTNAYVFIKTETSVGSIFGRPYNARPFGLPPRPTTNDQGLGLFPSFPQRPTPNPDGEVPSPDHWNKPNRWEKEKAANQRFNMTRVLSKRTS